MTQLQKNLATLGVVAAVGTGAGLYAYFGVLKKQVTEAEAKEAAAKAFDFDKTQVKKVTLSAKGDTVVAEKDGDNWKIVSPVQARGDKSAFDAIVDKLKDLKSKETLADDHAKLAEWGLDKPKFQVKASLGDGKELSLDVGEENPFDLSLPYVKGGDSHVYLSDSGLKWPLDKGLFDLRDKAIVTHEDKDVQSIAVSGEQTWGLERDGDNWKLTAPVQDRADKSVVDGILSRLRYARAKSFASEQPPADAAGLKKWGLDKPTTTVVFALGADKARKTLQFGKADDGGTKKTWARLVEGGPVMEVEDSLPSDVAKPLADLRDKTVAPFDREKVARLDIDAGAGKVSVTRKKETPPDGGWANEEFAIVDHADAKPKTWKISSALYTLSSLKGAAIADENARDFARFGLDKPSRTYVVSGAGGELAKVLVGSATGSRYYVKAGTGSRVLEVEKSTVDDLPSKLDDVVEAPPPPEPKKAEAAPAAESLPAAESK